MAQDKKSKTTDELLRLLSQTSRMEDFLDKYGDNLSELHPADYLRQMLTQHRISKQDALKAANLDYSLGYQIFNGYRKPSRNALLRLALAMGLSLDETQRLLKIAQRGELYPKARRDAAILFCIQNRMDVFDADILLERIGEELLD